MESSQATRNPSIASSSAGLKRDRRAVVESSEEEIGEHGPAANSARPGQQTHQSSRQKNEAKSNEVSDDEDIEADGNRDDDDIVNPPNLKRLRKSDMFQCDHSNKTTKLNEDIAGHNGPTNGVNYCINTEDKKKGGENTFNITEQMKRETMQVGEISDVKEKVFGSVSSNAPGPNCDDASDNYKFIFEDPGFFNFDELRSVGRFRANQIWSVYDDQGCMPRLYARITKVKTAPEFMVNFVWLEFDPTSKAEESWSDAGLPVASGCFKLGKSESFKETGLFSRIISFEKSMARNTYEIFPRKGEVWALFKGWDIGWSSDADNHKNYQYEVVQVVSDLTKHTNIIAMPLVKIKGYISLFIQSREAAPYVIPLGGTLRFSHCVPHHLMKRREREGIPDGSLELDPAALPLALEEACPSVVPECSSVRSQECGAKYAGSSTGNNFHKGSMGVGEREHTSCTNAGITAETPKENSSKQNTHTAEATDVGDTDICRTEYVHAESEFYDFSEIRVLQNFSPGQIWALYSDVDMFPNYYASIQSVDLKNSKVQCRWLDVCPQGKEEKRLFHEERPIGCGTFRLSIIHEMMTYTSTDAFSHSVEARSTGRSGNYEIIPHLGEIWAVYKNWRAGWTAQDFEKCKYELVEIVCLADSAIQVRLFRRVDGYTAVFMPYKGKGSMKSIRKDEYPMFSHQIPFFRLTHEKGGKLQGYVELDPLSLPEEFLFTEST